MARSPDDLAPPPILSVVVVIVSDTTDGRANVSHLAGCLEALCQQRESPPIEIIVPHHPYVAGIQSLKARFPNVDFLRIDDLHQYSERGGSREHHDELRARGLAAAAGRLVGLLEDHARPDPYWCRRAIEAHRQAYAAVGGAIENGIDLSLNWAVYFCDFGKYQNPLKAGESPVASDANVVYKRLALEGIRPVWRQSFQETAVHAALLAGGNKLALCPEMIVLQHRDGLSIEQAVSERFVWGRSYAVSRIRGLGVATRLAYAALAPVLPCLLLARMTSTALKKRRTARAFLRAFPLTALLTTSWSCGEMVGYLAGQSAGGAARRRTATTPPPPRG